MNTLDAAKRTDRHRAPAWGADLPLTEDDARERLIEAAEACFVERGPSRTKVTHVAAKAGVHRTTVYSYFPNMDAILAACFVRAAGSVVAAAEPYFAEDRPFIDRLINAMMAGLHAARSNPTMLSMTAPHDLARTHRAAERSEAWRTEIVEGLAARFATATPGEVRTDVSPHQMAHWVARIAFSLIEDPGSPDVGGDEGLLRAFLPGAIAPQARPGRASRSR
ncbi:TetR/AcrR family transcriptional regulator [Mycobacterium sp. E796]|uniref:TetR/AcrR family transcriptional regulator n=1 Tax=Mycobacterium sp. E796 TaxID=1834151 RepID=UPI0007FFAF41|nr:TetR/AcrR family transcriptional regulator [Mycobacterium sp. E796]OBI44811.1 TetR family transcriptional regulator [Mycobacterium sp. E796]